MGEQRSSDQIFKACVDAGLFRSRLASLGYDHDTLGEDSFEALYLDDGRLSALSPNSHFDEAWYLQQYGDVNAAVASGHVKSGFLHFIQHGLFEGRWPSPQLHGSIVPLVHTPPTTDFVDDVTYMYRYPVAKDFVESFPIIDVLHFHNFYGRYMGFVPEAGDPTTQRSRAHLRILAREFDEEWYARTYMGSGLTEDHDPLTHYLVEGMVSGKSPNSWFDEEFYRAFYPEIMHAIDRGDIPSGFYHYVLAGRAEKRLPIYERKAVLEARLPGVTQAGLQERMTSIRARMSHRRIVVDENKPRGIFMLLPTINPDITFGGYRSALELIRRLSEEGWVVAVVCTEDANASVEYFIWKEKKSIFRKVFSEINFIPFLEQDPLVVGSNDVVIAYSLWDLYFADNIRKLAPNTHVVLLSQEFEPIFHDNNAARALLEEAYNIPHYPVINSNFLKSFFASHRIGVFGGAKKPRAQRDYTVFEHRINQLKRQSVEDIRNRDTRVLVAYTRPEGHAARNLFEILILALQKVCEEGIFSAEWTFVGLGTLTDMPPVPLGGGHHLTLHAKMSEEEYTRYISSMDIGLSLMYAPHPSVMPFEFATTGALVVTNTFENRSASELAAISGNIIAGPPTVEGTAQCLREAVSRVENAEERIANIFNPAFASWNDIFSSDVLAEICKSPPPSS